MTRIHYFSPSSIIFSNIEKIVNDKVFTLLEQIPRSQGMICYLKLIKRVLIAYCYPNIESKERLKNAVYCVEFLRLWKQDSLNKVDNRKDSHFVTTGIFDSMELDLIMLLSLIIKAKDQNINELSSQSCENFFRLLRSFTTVESTVVNFTLKGIISRISKILFVGDVSHKLGDVMRFDKSEKVVNSNNINQNATSMAEIQNSICVGRIEAKNDARSLKICQEVSSFRDVIKPVNCIELLAYVENTDEEESDTDYFDVLNNYIEHNDETLTFDGNEFSNQQTGFIFHLIDLLIFLNFV